MTGTPDDGNNVPGYGQSDSQNPNSQPPAASEEHHCPKPGYEPPKPEKANKHWLEYVTAGFALVAALGSISAAVVGCWQWSVMNGQLDVMRDQNRPWIRAKITFARPLIFTDWDKQKHLHVSLNFDLKNFGNIPARNIRISTFVSAHPGTAKKRQLDDSEASACKQAREMADSDKIGGVASFPGEPVTVNTGGGSGPVYQDGQPTLFSILGCIDYTYSDDRHGTTGFRKMLGRVEGNFVVGLPFVVGTPRPPPEPISPELLASGYPNDPPIVGEMPTDNVWFQDEDSGNYAK